MKIYAESALPKGDFYAPTIISFELDAIPSTHDELENIVSRLLSGRQKGNAAGWCIDKQSIALSTASKRFGLGGQPGVWVEYTISADIGGLPLAHRAAAPKETKIVGRIYQQVSP